MEMPKWFCGTAFEWRSLTKVKGDKKFHSTIKKVEWSLDATGAMDLAESLGKYILPAGMALGGTVGAVSVGSLPLGLVAGLMGTLGGIVGGIVFTGLSVAAIFSLGYATTKSLGFLGKAREEHDIKSLASKIDLKRGHLLLENINLVMSELDKNKVPQNYISELKELREALNSVCVQIESNEESKPEVLAKKTMDFSDHLEQIAETVRKKIPDAFANEPLKTEVPMLAATLEGRLIALGSLGNEGVAAIALARIALTECGAEGPEKFELENMIASAVPKLLDAWEKVPLEKVDVYLKDLESTPKESLIRGLHATFVRVTELRESISKRAALGMEAEARVLEARVMNADSLNVKP